MKNIRSFFKEILLKLILFIENYAIIISSNILGIFFLGYIFYNRLFRIRVPKTLDDLTIIFIFIGLVIIVLHIFVIRYNVKKLKEHDNKNELEEKPISNIKISIRYLISRIIRIAVTIKDTFLNSYKSVLDNVLLTFQGGKLGHYLFTLPSFFFIRKFENEKHIKVIYYLCFLFPRLLVTFVFFVEVIFFNEIRIFYKILWILIIPLIARILRFTYREVAWIGIRQLDPYFHVSENISEQDGPFVEHKIITFMYLDPDVEAHFGEAGRLKFLSTYEQFTMLYYYWNYFYILLEHKPTRILNILISSIMLITWLYIIISYFILHSKLYIFLPIISQLLVLSTCVVLIILCIIDIEQRVITLYRKVKNYLKK